MAQKWLSGPQPKWLKSDSKVTQTVGILLSHFGWFWVTSLSWIIRFWANGPNKKKIHHETLPTLAAQRTVPVSVPGKRFRLFRLCFQNTEGLAKGSKWLTAKMDSPLSRGNVWLTLALAQIVSGSRTHAKPLTAQCERPPPRLYRAMPFRDSTAEGGIARVLPCFHVVSRKYRWDTPLFWGGGVSHLHFACAPKGKRSDKGEGTSHPIGHVETPRNP